MLYPRVCTVDLFVSKAAFASGQSRGDPVRCLTLGVISFFDFLGHLQVSPNPVGTSESGRITEYGVPGITMESMGTEYGVQCVFSLLCPDYFGQTVLLALAVLTRGNSSGAILRIRRINRRINGINQKNHSDMDMNG